MRTRSSSNLPVVSSSNPPTSNLKRHNRRRSKQPFILEESPVDTMADQRTMAELLRVPTEGYAEAIVVPPILAEQFELKHILLNMMTTDQFFGLEKDNPHDHIRWFNKITSTIKYKDVPNSAIKLMLFPFSLAGAARRWLEKEPSRSIHTWEDLVSKFINEFFPPQEQQISVMKSPIFNNGLMNRFMRLGIDTNISFMLALIMLHINITLADALILMPKYQKMLKALLSNKEKLQELENTPLNENCSAVILKKLPEKLGDLGKFLISCGFSLTELIFTRMTLELANRAIWTPTGIAKDVFVSVGKFTFPADFIIVDYESDPRVPLILGRPFLQTARALIDVHGEEMIICDSDERLTLNMRHDTSSYSNQPQKELINLINVFNNSSEDFLEDLFSNQPSGNPTFSSHPEITSLKVKNDIFDSEGGNALPEKLLDLDSTKDLHPPLHFDVESDLKEIEFLLHQDIDSSLKDSIDQSNLANPADNFVDSMHEMFTDEHALDYSSSPIFDEYDDDFLEVESDNENVKENQEKDKIGSKPDKNEQRGKAGKSLKLLQLKEEEEEKPKKTKKEWPKTHTRIKSY
nr:reverse transcriptase domain-containing protein [Tanacetum cinerariifolium]